MTFDDLLAMKLHPVALRNRSYALGFVAEYEAHKRAKANERARLWARRHKRTPAQKAQRNAAARARYHQRPDSERVKNRAKYAKYRDKICARHRAVYLKKQLDLIAHPQSRQEKIKRLLTCGIEDHASFVRYGQELGLMDQDGLWINNRRSLASG